MWQRAMTASGGGGLKISSASWGASGTYTKTMRNGVFWLVRDGATTYVYLHGYIKDGRLTKTGGNQSGYNASYSSSTGVLTLTTPASAPGGTVYYAVAD